MKKSAETMQYINNDKLVHKISNFMGQSVHDGSTCPLKTIGFYDFVKCEVTTYKMPVFREVALAHRVLNINFSTWSKVGRNIWSLQKLYRSKHIPSLAKNYLLWGFMGPIFNAAMDLFSWYTELGRWSSRPWKWLAEINTWKTSGF